MDSALNRFALSRHPKCRPGQIEIMGEKTELEIELLLPGIHGADDGCVQRLKDLIEARRGIDRVHLRPVAGDASDRLCVHFDSRQISVGEIRRFARQAGADLGQQYGHLLLTTDPMAARQARQLDARLEALPGVLDAGVSADGVLRIEYDRQQVTAFQIEEQIALLGVTIERELVSPAEDKHRKRAPCDHRHAGVFGEHRELIFALLCGVCLASGWLLAVAGYAPYWLSWSCLVAAYAFGGFFIVREAFEKTLLGRFEIDFLMIVAALGAAILGKWAEGGLLLFLFSLGHALEHFAMGRARRAIEALAELAPATALAQRSGKFVEVAVEELLPGDVVLVRAHERIPVDGFVIRGSSTVDQAPITGESIPVDKRAVEDPAAATADPGRLPEDNRVFAGTINQQATLEIEVTRLARESTLARVVTMVSEAETQTSPTQQFTDRFERYFVPAVLGLVLLLHFAFLLVDESFAESFYRAMAVLVAASPCALAISTPSAVLSGIARAARSGVLVKGGGPLEHLGKLSAMAFDKTGTLTSGQLRLVDVKPCAGVSREFLLQTAVPVERLSDHPLAEAVVRDGLQMLNNVSQPVARDLRSFVGRGVQATINDQQVHLGKAAMFTEDLAWPIPDELQQQVDELERNGRTTIIVGRNRQFLGVLGLMDTPRPSSQQTVRQLRKLGIHRMVLISGDNQFVVEAVARHVGIAEAWGNLMPEDKLQAIRRLRQDHGVAMVGDGVNDAPAMANATVGIAMGAAGSDVALETADIALMADDLGRLPFAVALSRQTSRIIRQNLWCSLGMVAILVPATMLGLRLGWAVLLHEGSTMLVVINALRLLAFRPP
jgi:Cd2+/Zn2+-exporting ATPase